MDIRQITDRYHVSPQIDPEDAAAIAAAGYAMVVCNRPDAEVPPSHQAAAMEQALEAHGIPLVVLPVTHQTLTPDFAANHWETCCGADGPVLAYCASGTRCTILWAVSNAATLGVDAVIDGAARAGYDLAGMRPALSALAGR